VESLEQRNLLSFAPAVNYPISNSDLDRIAAGDFSGNHRPDLAMTDVRRNAVDILLNRGNGTFGSPVFYPLNGLPSGIAVGDFNGDGKLDLVVADESFGTIAVLLGNGDGTFQNPSYYPAASVEDGPAAVAVGDFNGDGKLDVAVAVFRGSQSSVLLGKGDGTFGPPIRFESDQFIGQVRFVTTADLNHDGKLDLVTAVNQPDIVQVLLGNGDGTFQPPVAYQAGPTPVCISVGDFNGDGNLDLAVVNPFNNTVNILLGKGDGTFQPATSFSESLTPVWIAAGDFNKTGRLDLAIANYGSGNVSVLPGNGDGTFQAPQSYGTDAHSTALAVADFNGDGTLDVAVANSFSGDVSVLLNQTGLPPGNQAFVAQVYLDLLGRPADPGGLAFWTGLLDRGVERGDVVGLMEQSPEYRTDQVEKLYQIYLHRPADPVGQSLFVPFLEAGGSLEQVAASILGSPEYFVDRGSGSNDGFLTALYLDVLGRSVDPSGRAAWDQALAAGASQAQVAAAILGSLEYQQGLIQSFYTQFLHRPADPGGLATFVSALQLGARDEQIIIAIMASDEYFSRLA
jgi:hypothetical protein